MVSHCHFVMTRADQISEWFHGAIFFFFLPLPQPTQWGWESLQPILWMYLSWLISIDTLEKLVSGWSPPASPLLGRPHVIGRAGPAEVFEFLGGRLIVWKSVPRKDLSGNFWRTFSPKWVVASKKLTNFHLRVPGRKRSPSFWNQLIWSSWKPSLAALRVSPSVYEGVSGKLVCGTKVPTPTRSWFCNAALLAAWSAACFPCDTSVLPVWCPLQRETETTVGRWIASKSLRIWSPYLIGDPWVIKWPLFK